MKTPREILLTQHQSAAPKLDAIRRKVVRELNNQVTKEQGFSFITLFLRCSKTLWHELIFPSRRIWAGLATAWIFIFIINFTLRDHSSKSMAGASTAMPEMMSFKDQQKFVNELFADRSLPVESDRPKIFSPKPRTEIMEFFAV